MVDIFMLQLFRQRKATEKVVGGPCLEQEEINRLYNHSS